MRKHACDGEPGIPLALQPFEVVRDEERGASLVEYALLVAFIAVVCAVAVGQLGGIVNSSYSSTNSGFAAN